MKIVSDTSDFRLHSASQHVPHHFVIRDKRPQRIFKSCGFVMFNKKVRKPGEGVTDDQTKRKINPVIVAQNPDKQNKSERRADKMQVTRHRMAVFLNIEIP